MVLCIQKKEIYRVYICKDSHTHTHTHTHTYKGLRKTVCMVFINLKDNEKPTVNK